nr:MAG TPA: Molybdenum Cofactor Synthesis C [Caudoviricetes sp.]
MILLFRFSPLSCRFCRFCNFIRIYIPILSVWSLKFIYGIIAVF